jgi:hypothetical protein
MAVPTSYRSSRPQIRYWPDLLRRESSGSKARRGAASLWPKGGWPAQHGARARWEVSLVEITTGVHRGAGGTWVAKKAPPNWPWMQLGRCVPQMAPSEVLVRF